MDRLSSAEFAARRHLVGFTLDQLAAVLRVIPRTVLIGEHTGVVQEMLDADVPVHIARDGAGSRPRGWYVAAAARAIAVEPDLIVEWLVP